MARCLLLQSELPKNLWNHALRTASWLVWYGNMEYVFFKYRLYYIGIFFKDNLHLSVWKLVITSMIVKTVIHRRLFQDNLHLSVWKLVITSMIVKTVIHWRLFQDNLHISVWKLVMTSMIVSTVLPMRLFQYNLHLSVWNFLSVFLREKI